jgi:hypothetical protein
LQASAGQRLLAKQQAAAAAAAAGGQNARDSHESELYRREAYPNNWQARQAGVRAPPFELEVLEGVLMVATGVLLRLLIVLGCVSSWAAAAAVQVTKCLRLLSLRC